MIAQFLLAEYL